jgi:predicted neutral ceramidase superfamily lipid hydrolase
MPPLKLIEALLQQAIAEGSRSTALKPLGWLLAMLLPSTLLSVWEKSSLWLAVFLAIVSMVVFAVYIGAFLYLLVHDRDALRSETYSLRKMAIQQGAAPDSVAALMESDEPRQVSKETEK